MACSPQACKPCSCPATGWKTEPRVSTRKVSDLLDRKSYKSELKVWSDTPPPMAGGRQDATAIVKTWRRRRPSVTGYLMSQGFLVARGTGARATVLPFTI